MVAQVGDLVPTTNGRWKTVAPTHCPNGHQLGARRVLVGHQPCSEGGHMTWTCRECDSTVYAPDLSSACRVIHGPAAIRNV
jgi:hypothetical protein